MSKLGIGIAVLLLALAVPLVDWQHYLLTKLPNRPVDCPAKAFTIVVFGQSDAANTGDRRRVGPAHSYFFSDGECYSLRDPVMGGASGGGSIWPSLAARIPEPVVVISEAVNGASIDDLSGAPLDRLMTEVTAARAKGLSPDLTIFLQGDTDAVKRTSAGHYLARLQALRKALPGKWIIPEGEFCTPEDPQTELARARRQLAATDKLVTVGPNLDVLGLELRRDDKCHFNRRGQDRIADMLAASI